MLQFQIIATKVTARFLIVTLCDVDVGIKRLVAHTITLFNAFIATQTWIPFAAPQGFALSSLEAFLLTN
jgi:hypothetical protein